MSVRFLIVMRNTMLLCLCGRRRCNNGGSFNFGLLKDGKDIRLRRSNDLWRSLTQPIAQHHLDHII